MDENTSCCDKIMHDVACKEERRLIRTLFLAGPLLIVCSWLVIVAIHMSITTLLEKEAFTVASDIENEGRSFSEYVFVVLTLFWSQMRKDFIVLLALALTLISLIVTKAKLLSFPFRVREIKKYKILEEETSTPANV